MTKRVYIETTIVSYLTARPSRDLTRAAQEQTTRKWWRSRHLYELYTSQAVLDEAARGDADAADRRLAVLRALPVVGPIEPAIELARQIIKRKLMPLRAATDALHLTIAATHQLDVLLTWNCTHLANAIILVDVGKFLRKNGYELPIVCTPNEMMGDLGES